MHTENDLCPMSTIVPMVVMGFLSTYRHRNSSDDLSCAVFEFCFISLQASATIWIVF